ncbi:MAG: hypothetical protein E7773_14265 [Sphingomonas sp.]|nr:MAG: hypothetical protein E7773_14265 [Sphingomonas sp.]
MQEFILASICSTNFSADKPLARYFVAQLGKFAQNISIEIGAGLQKIIWALQPAAQTKENEMIKVRCPGSGVK